MKQAVIIIVILFSVVSEIYSQWTKNSVGVAEWSVANALNISPDGILSLFVRTSNLPRKINVSFDYGLTWHHYNTSNEYDGTCITSVDSGRIWFCTDDGKIFNSIDSGKTWAIQYHDSVNSCFFDYIKFFDKENGVAVADASTNSSPMIILKTSNGGKDWISVNSSYLIGESAKDVFYQISFPNQDTGYIFGYISNKLYKTIDGGITWIEVKIPSIIFDISAVSFYNRDLGIVVCWESFQTGSLYRTTDGGNSWDKLGLIPKTWINDIEFLPSAPQNIWFSDFENLYFSSDTGNSWTLATISDPQLKVSNIEFLNDSIGFLLCYESNFYVTLNNGGFISEIKENTITNFPAYFSLSQNYPNPFNPSTTISYQIPEASFVTLKVYDVLGREVATLVNEEQAAGNYNYQFSIGNYQLSSGIYFYTLKAGSFSEMKKMILMK